MATDVGSRLSTTLFVVAVVAVVAVVVGALVLGRDHDDVSSDAEIAPLAAQQNSMPAEPTVPLAERIVAEPSAESDGVLKQETPSVMSQRQEPADRSSSSSFDVVFDKSVAGRERQQLIADLESEARRVRKPEMPPELRRAIDEGTLNTIPPEFEEALRHQPAPPADVRAAVERGDTMPVPPPHIQKQFDEASRRIREQGRETGDQ